MLVEGAVAWHEVSVAFVGDAAAGTMLLLLPPFVDAIIRQDQLDSSAEWWHSNK